jgi:hypothetical protein
MGMHSFDLAGFKLIKMSHTRSAVVIGGKISSVKHVTQKAHTPARDFVRSAFVAHLCLRHKPP